MDEQARRQVVVRFAAPDEDLHRELVPVVIGEPGTALVRDPLLEVAADAIVSPANSFGWMDGGLDAQLLEHYGASLQDQVRATIARHWDGELPVGCAVSVPLPRDHPDAPRSLVVAPTMRVPMRLPADTVAPYLAVRAAVREAVRLAGERPPDELPLTLALPGMGTGVGGVPPQVFARQAAAALRSLREPPPDDWWAGSRAHQLLTGTTVRDLQVPPGEREPAAPHPGDGHLVEDTVDALGDRRTATVRSSGGELVARVRTEDASGIREREVVARPDQSYPTAAQLARHHHGAGEELLDAVRALPGASETDRDDTR